MKSDTAVCAALFLTAAAVRLLFLSGTVDRELPFSVFYYGDSRIYREFAFALMRGTLFDQGIPVHPPAFAYVLSWIIRWTGERPTVVRAVLAIGGATVAPLTYLLGRAIWNRAVGAVAALLATFSFGLCVLSASPNVEAIYVPVLVAQALLLVGLGDAASTGRAKRAATLAVLGGIVLGLGSLTRAEHLAYVAVLPVSIAFGWPSLPRRSVALYAAAMGGVAMLAIAPWTIHNHRALARFNAEHPTLAEPLPTWVGVIATGPLNFALANNARTDGTFQPDAVVAGMGRGRLDLEDAAQADLYLHGYRRGLSFLVGDPGAAVSLLAGKIALASDAYALGFGLSNWPGGLTGTRRPVDVFSPKRRIFKPVSLVLLAAGLWLSRSVLRRGSILWLAGLLGLAVTLATFGYARFFLQAAPFVFLFQAAAVLGATSRWRTRGGRRAAALLGVAVAVALTVELAVATARPLNFRASGSTDPATGKIVQDAAVELEAVSRVRP